MSADVDMEMDEMKEIIDDFLVEADELIESLDTNLVKLESAPGDLELLNEIFRAAHTIKGTSSFLGFEQVTGLTHKMEDILNKLRKSEMTVTPEIMDILLESLDLLKVLLQNVRAGNTEEIPLGDIIERLVAALNSQGDQPASADKEQSLPAAPEESSPEMSESGTARSNNKTASGSDARTAAPARGSKVRADNKVIDQTIRVEVSRLDSLMNLMGELVLGRNALIQSIHQLAPNSDAQPEYEHLTRSSASINHITTELQLAIMKMRMQPIGKVFGRFPRLVRDLARESGKEIELVISGETTELDKSVLEEIGDPLVHLIRNSCDHGIEKPDERLAKGKPRKGTVKLSASQEGSNIIIRIEDDGKGLDAAAIRAKAVERGLVGSEEVEQMPDREVFRFIFEPGFSTAKVVTDVSGRGVGMDVVRSNIEKINGLIALESTPDVGTTTEIKLPLTLAIVQGLLIKSDEEVYILPLSSVHETVKTEHACIHYVNQRPVMRLRDEIIPVINLGDVLRKNARGFVLTEKPYVVVVGLADRKLGINIDCFLGQEEVVIKSLGEYLGQTEGIAGATILGDGRIRLIVDLLGLFNIVGKLA